MKYSFRSSELKFINKFVFANKLYGLQNSHLPCFKTKNKMIKEGILNRSDNIEISSLYLQMFNDWSKMQYAITFPNQGRYGLESYTILCNDNKIVTIENDLSIVDVGYFIYEYIGYRNYILDKLNLKFELKVKKEIDFVCFLSENEFEQFMSYDCDLYKKISAKTGIDDVILGGLATDLNDVECKTFYTKNIQSGIKSEFKIYSNVAANFWCKKTCYSDGTISYIVGITNTTRLLREIQNFS